MELILIMFYHDQVQDFLTNEKRLKVKKNIKIYIKTAPTCFGALTPSSGSALFVLATVTVVKIVI